MFFTAILFLFCVGDALTQYHPTTTPVPILKQINRHNGDGSYSFGFEAADGSYKIESKYPNGEIYGKYGFYDDTGSLREVEYGASRRGFEPTGTGINVPPATVQGNGINGNEPEDDGQYREDPSVYYTDPKYTNGEKYDRDPPKQYLQYQRPVPRPVEYEQPYEQPHLSKSSGAYRQPQELYNRPRQPNSIVSKRYNHHRPIFNYNDGPNSYTVQY